MVTDSNAARHIECSMAEYHARPEWSHSQSEVLRASPPLFKGRFVSKVFPPPSSNAFDVGTVAHQCLTAPGGIADVVAEIPPSVLNADGHCKGSAWLVWSDAHADKIQMKADELAPIRHMIANVYAHKRAAWLLGRTIGSEFTLIGHDADSGLDIRARLDLVVGHRGQVVVVDYKTTRAMTPYKFARDAMDYGYHRQIAWYSDLAMAFGYDVTGHLFIVSDKSPAHQCRVYELPDEAIDLGCQQNRWAREDLARRLDANDWSDPLGNDIYRVDLPVRAYHEGVNPYG